MSTVQDALARVKARQARESGGLMAALPDQPSAKVLPLAQRTGANVDFVGRNLSTFERLNETQRREQTLMAAPRLASFATTPENALIARDSLEELAALEAGIIRRGDRVNRKFLEETKRFFQSIPSRLQEGYFGQEQMYRESNRDAYRTHRFLGSRQIPLIMERLYETTGDPALAQYVGSTNKAFSDLERYDQTIQDISERRQQAKALADELTPKGRNVVERGVIAGASSFVQMTPGLIASIATRSPAPALAQAGLSTSGMEFGRARDEGLSVERARTYGLQQGGIEVATELLPFASLVGDFVKGTGFGRTLFNQIVTDVPGEQIATFAQDYNEWQTLNPEKTVEEFLDERLEAAAETFFASVFQSTLNAGIGAAPSSVAFMQEQLSTTEKVQEAEANRETLEEVRQAAVNSPAYQVSRDAVERFVDQASEGETVFLDGEAINTLYQSGDGMFSDILEALDLTEQDIGLALDGTDIQIPVSRVVTIEQDEISRFVLDNLRTVPDGMTPNQVQELREIDDLPADIREQLEDVGDEMMALEGFERVDMTVREKLIDAGRSPEEAEALGKIWGATFRRLAEDGLNEGEIFERLGLEVRGPQGRQAMPKEPQRLSDFVRRSGGVREGDFMRGERQAVIGDARSRLFNEKSGRSLDDMGELAFEAGYFSERPSVEEFLDALANDFQGDAPLYRASDAGAAAEYASAQQELQRELSPDYVLEQAKLYGITAEEMTEQLSAASGDVTKTVAFKSWFGDSKVVDDTGSPLVVYHGTTEGDFSSFRTAGRGKTSGTGAFFTDTRLGASTYSNDQKDLEPTPIEDILANPDHYDVEVEDGDYAYLDGDEYDLTTTEGRDALSMAASAYLFGKEGVYPVYLSLKNPLIFDAEGRNWDGLDEPQYFVDDNDSGESLGYYASKEEAEEAAAEFEEDGYSVSIQEDHYESRSTDDIAREARDKGHDGVIIKNVNDEGAYGRGYGWGNHTYIAFEPQQIKSVFNRGSFDPSSTSILAQARTEGYKGADRGEAAEWLAAKAKGLDMSQEARMQRARDMGFDTEQVLYHGTVEEFDAFGAGSANSGLMSGSTAISTDPVVANSYTKPLGPITRKARDLQRRLRLIEAEYSFAKLDATMTGGANKLAKADSLKAEKDRLKAAFMEEQRQSVGAVRPSHIIPVHVRIKNPLILDAEGRKWTNVDGLDSKNSDLNVKAKEALQEGYDALVVENVVDMGDLDSPRTQATTIIVFDPKNIRSINAAFDPDNTASSNLLAQSKVQSQTSDTFFDSRLSEMENKAVEMAKNGFSNDQIAQEVLGEEYYTLGWPVDKIKYILGKARKMGIDIPHGAPSNQLPSVRNQVRRLYDQGLTRAQIAERLGISPETVSWHRKMIRKEDKGIVQPAGRQRQGGKDFRYSTNEVLFQKERATVQIPDALGPVPGSGILSDENVIVRFTKAADKTTFLHESAHIFLELYAALEDTNEAVSARLAPVREWLGWEKGQPLTREQHEKFAGLEGFEGYAVKGETSNPELRSIFRVFRQWFLDVYNRLRGKSLNLDPRAREFFDAMLNAQENVALAEREYSAHVATTMSDVMTSEQLDKYKKHADRAGELARDQLFKKHLEEIRKRDRKAYKRDKARLEKEVSENLSIDPIYDIRANRKIGLVSAMEYDDSLSDGDLDGVVTPLGDNIELVAAEYGFDSPDTLVRALRNTPSLKAAVDREVKRQLDELHGNMLRGDEAYFEAVEAVFNEPSVKRMEVERDALAAKAARDAIPLNAIKARAQQMIDTLPIDQIIQPGRYAIKARDLHKRSIREAARANWDEALRLTHQAMLQHELARRAYKARDEIAVINRYLNRFAPHKKIDPKKVEPQFIEPLRQIMGLPGADNQQEVMAELQDFESRMANENVAIILPPDVVLDQPLPQRRKMTMDQLRAFRDGVKSIYTAGRAASVEASAERVKFHGELAADIMDAWGDKPPQSETRNPNFGDRFKGWAQQGDAKILALPFIAEAFQGGLRGRIVDVLYNKLAEAQSRRERRAGDLQEALVSILDQHGITQAELNKKRSIPELDRNAISQQNLFALLLNLGNAGNKARVDADPSYSMTTAEIQPLLEDVLGKRYFDAAQAIWDLIETQRADLGAVHKRRTGVTPQWVKAEELQTSFGTYRGGYYPITYDPSAAVNQDLAKQTEEDAFKQFSSASNAKAQTKAGMLIERQNNVERPLDWSLGALLKHFDQTSALIEMSAEIDQAWSVINSHQVGEAIKATHGKEYIEAVKTILRRTANPGAEVQTILPRFVNNALRTFRVNAGVAILGFNIRTALLSPVSYIQTVLPRYGGKVVARGWAEFMSKGPIGVPERIKFIKGKSKFMEERMRTLNQEAYERVQKKVREGVWSRIQGSGYWLMQSVEINTVSGPLWLGTYRDSLDQGMTDAEAVSAADTAVANTQGSGRTLDQSVLQSSPDELVRVFTFMWGFVSRHYGIVRNDVAKEQGMKKALPLMKHFIVLNIMAAMSEAIIRNGFGDDEESYAETVLKLLNRNTFGIVPGFSQIFSKYDSGPAVAQFGTKVVQSSESYAKIFEDGEFDAEQFMDANRKALDAAMFGAGVPGTVQLKQIEKTYTEDDDPTLIEALITGPDGD